MTKFDDLMKNYENLDLAKLPQELRKNGFDYVLIERTQEACIYAQKIGGLIVAYEVFKTKILPFKKEMERLKKSVRNDINTNYQEYREAFPHDEEFGKRAWTFKELSQALECYKGLNDRSKLTLSTLG